MRRAEANLPAQAHPAPAPSWLSPPHVVAGRPERHPRAAREGAAAPRHRLAAAVPDGCSGDLWGAAPAMRREERLRRRNDFAAVYKNGRIQSNQLLVLRVLPNNRETTRFGFVVGKTVGGAVVRNRVKRRLREAARSLVVRPGFDVVIGARKPAAEAKFQALRASLASLMERARLCESAPAEAP